LDFVIKYVVLKKKVINRYGNYNHNHFEGKITSYINASTTFTKMSKTLESKRGFKKDDMYVVIAVESITTMSSILGFKLEVVIMFSTWILLRN